MTSRPTGSSLAGLARTVGLALLALALWTSAASASHYRLAESGLVTPAELAALAKAEVHTTKDVVDKLGPKRARRAVAKSSRLKPKRLIELARTCDLLRIDGLGMIMARLLTAAGAPDTAVLKSADAKSLAAAVNAANAAKKITEVTPDAAQLGQWITQAKGLKQVLELR